MCRWFAAAAGGGGRGRPPGAGGGDPWEFQAECVDAFVTSWRARGFSPVTIDNDIGLLERTLKALGCLRGR